MNVFLYEEVFKCCSSSSSQSGFLVVNCLISAKVHFSRFSNKATYNYVQDMGLCYACKKPKIAWGFGGGLDGWSYDCDC